MARPTILVTGATGKTGGAVVRRLIDRGFAVRAMIHREDARSVALARLGAETVLADMHDPDQLHAALRGVQRAYYVPIFAPHALHAAMAFAEAARASRLEAVVQLSQWLSHRAHPSILTREIWLIDRLFAMLPDTAHVIVNPGMFADNFLRIIDFPALLGFYPILTGPSRSAPVANEDIARVVAELLAEPDRHAGRRFRPTGPALLSGREMAAIIARVVGHRVMPVDLPFWMFRKVARMTGASAHEVLNYRDYLRDHRAGAFSFDGGVTDVVEALCGAPAEPFEATARRYAAMPFARPSLGNRLRAFARFNLVPFYPGHDLDRYVRELALPVPPHPTLASDDASWRAGHALPHADQVIPATAA